MQIASAEIYSRDAEMEPAQGQRLSAVAVGKQSEVADLDETGGQHIEREAADELDPVERDDVAVVTMTDRVTCGSTLRTQQQSRCSDESCVRKSHDEYDEMN